MNDLLTKEECETVERLRQYIEMPLRALDETLQLAPTFVGLNHE